MKAEVYEVDLRIFRTENSKKSIRTKKTRCLKIVKGRKNLLSLIVFATTSASVLMGKLDTPLTRGELAVELVTSLSMELWGW